MLANAPGASMNQPIQRPDARLFGLRVLALTSKTKGRSTAEPVRAVQAA